MIVSKTFKCNKECITCIIFPSLYVLCLYGWCHTAPLTGLRSQRFVSEKLTTLLVSLEDISYVFNDRLLEYTFVPKEVQVGQAAMSHLVKWMSVNWTARVLISVMSLEFICPMPQSLFVCFISNSVQLWEPLSFLFREISSLLLQGIRWRWRQQIPLKQWYSFTRIHGVTS